MAAEPSTAPPDGPLLLCAGTDAAAAALLADVAAPLLAGRRAVVLASWAPPLLLGPLNAVMDAFYDTHHDLRAAACEAAGRAAAAAIDALERHGVEATSRVVSDQRAPWRIILEVADELDAALIVAGANERASLHLGALGGEARALAHRAHRPLLVVPAAGEPARADAPALFAYDGSETAAYAVGAAARLLRLRPAVVATAWHAAADTVGAALLAIPDEVARTGAARLDDASRRAAAERAGEGASMLAAAGWPCETETPQTAHGVAPAIVAAAGEHDAAVVVSGTRGRSRIAAALLGSNAEAILRHAGRPVLLVPAAPA